MKNEDLSHLVHGRLMLEDEYIQLYAEDQRQAKRVWDKVWNTGPAHQARLRAFSGQGDLVKYSESIPVTVHMNARDICLTALAAMGIIFRRRDMELLRTETSNPPPSFDGRGVELKHLQFCDDFNGRSYRIPLNQPKMFQVREADQEWSDLLELVE